MLQKCWSKNYPGFNPPFTTKKTGTHTQTQKDTHSHAHTHNVHTNTEREGEGESDKRKPLETESIVGVLLNQTWNKNSPTQYKKFIWNILLQILKDFIGKAIKPICATTITIITLIIKTVINHFSNVRKNI
jgi:hypothetical protein